MGFLGQFFGLLARAPFPGEPPAEGIVLVVTGSRWWVEQGGETIAGGVLTVTNNLVISVADFCRVLGLRKREERGH